MIYFGDRKELLADPILDKVGLILNQQFNFVSCKHCGFLLSNWENHLKRHKILKNVNHDERKHLQEVLKDTSENPTFPDEILVQGLSVVEGFACGQNNCNFTSLNKANLSLHCRKEGHSNGQGCSLQFSTPQKYRQVRLFFLLIYSFLFFFSF